MSEREHDRADLAEALDIIRKYAPGATSAQFSTSDLRAALDKVRPALEWTTEEKDGSFTPIDIPAGWVPDAE